MSKEEILEKISYFKNRRFGEVSRSAEFNEVSFSIILLTADCSGNEKLMELLGRWRKENEAWFLSQFEVTTARTTRWFKDKVTGQPERLLFIIKVGDEYIGHVGLFRFNFENNTCEVDNIVRGEKKYPGIIGAALEEMMEWGRANLSLKGYSLKVLADNERAIRLYRKLGFEETGRIPLIEIFGQDGPELTEAPAGQESKAVRFYSVMELA